MRYTWYARSAMVALAVPAVVALTDVRGGWTRSPSCGARSITTCQGHATGLGDHFRAAFHPEGRVVSMRDGELAMMNADEGHRVRRIERIDITGDGGEAGVQERRAAPGRHALRIRARRQRRVPPGRIDAPVALLAAHCRCTACIEHQGFLADGAEFHPCHRFHAHGIGVAIVRWPVPKR